MRASAEPFLSLKGVSKTYRAGGRETVAVSDATFDLADGEFLALVGPIDRQESGSAAMPASTPGGTSASPSSSRCC